MTKRFQGVILAVLLLPIPAVCGRPLAVGAALERIRETVWVAYAPTNFDPGATPAVLPSEESIRADLRVLRAAGFDGIVTYGADLPAIARIAEDMGFHAMLLGIWAPGNADEMRFAKQAASSRIVVGVIVGNEGLTFHRYSLPELHDAMEQIRRDTGKLVSTTEIVESYFTKPELAEWSDFLAVNAHPYFHEIREPIPAVEWTEKAYANLSQRYPDKFLLFKEVGLPTAGDGLTEQSQFEYYRALRQTQVHFVYFEAFDALFKQGATERSWGILHADRTPKPAAALVKPQGSAGPDPLGARDAAIDMVLGSGLAAARAAIGKMLTADPPISTAYQFSYLAELMKLSGDYRASEYYGKAIAVDPHEPAHDLLFGEYLRNFRGPMQPLFGDAEKHLAEAARKLACYGDGAESRRRMRVKDQLNQAIITLHEGDGLPLFSWITKEAGCSTSATGLSLYLSLGVRGGETLADLDVTADIGDLTSAAAYSQSLRATLGPLNTSLLRNFLRTVTPFENRNRLRARYRGARLDLFFTDHRAGDAAITNPYLRDPMPLTNRDLVLYNPLSMTEFGASVEKPFRLFDLADADITATYQRIRRTGLVDYNPTVREDINEEDVSATISRSVGPDKANVQFTFVNQSIVPDLAPYQSRSRQIYAGTFKYQAYRLGSGGYSRAFQGTRGIDLYAGVLRDREDYGYAQPAIVDRVNYFAGLTVHALKKKVDLSIQPTWFTSVVPSNRTRDNQQYRTAIYGLYRFVDEERYGPGLPPKDWNGWRLSFVHLTVPFHRDTPQTGLAAFGNYKVGAELSAKWFTTRRGGTSFLGSARYDMERFNMLNRTFSLFTLGVSMGF